MKTNLNSKTSAGLQSLDRSELCQVEGGAGFAVLVGVAAGLVAIAAYEGTKQALKEDVKILERAQDIVRIGSR